MMQIQRELSARKLDLKLLYKEPLYRNSLAIILDMALVALFGLLFWIIAARLTPAKDIGLLAATLSAASMIMALSRLGIDAGLIRYLPNADNKSAIYGTISMFTLLASLVITSVFLLSLDFCSPALSFLRDGWYLPAFVLFIAAWSISTSTGVALMAMRKAHLYLVKDLAFGARIPLLLPLAAFGMIGVFFSYVIPIVISLLLGIYMLRRCGISFRPGLGSAPVREVLTFSLGNYFTGLSAIAPGAIVPLIIINSLGADTNAYFCMAFNIAAFLFIIPDAVALSLFVEGSHDQPLRETAIKSMKFIMIILVPAVAFICLFGDRVLMMFGQEYSLQSFEVLRLLAVSSLFSALVSVYLAIKKVQKDIKVINGLSFFLSCAIISLGYLGMIRYGLNGIGFAWLLSNIALAVIVLLLVVRFEKWI